jgi:hypothetical protein
VDDSAFSPPQWPFSHFPVEHCESSSHAWPSLLPPAASAHPAIPGGQSLVSAHLEGGAAPGRLGGGEEIATRIGTRKGRFTLPESALGEPPSSKPCT